MRRFEGKVAVVTGGGHGIGAATVRRLAEEGTTVALADLEPAAATEQLAAGGIEARPYRVDVSAEEAVGELAARVLAELGRGGAAPGCRAPCGGARD